MHGCLPPSLEPGGRGRSPGRARGSRGRRHPPPPPMLSRQRGAEWAPRAGSERCRCIQDSRGERLLGPWEPGIALAAMPGPGHGGNGQPRSRPRPCGRRRCCQKHAGKGPSVSGMPSGEDGAGAGLRIRRDLGVPWPSGWHRGVSGQGGRSGGPRVGQARGMGTIRPRLAPQDLTRPQPVDSWPAALGGRRGWAAGGGAGGGTSGRLALLPSLTYSLPYMPQCP